MKRISSTRLPKIRKVMALICLIVVIVIAEDTGEYLVLIPGFVFATIIFFRKHDVVYIDKNDFVVNGKKILITDVISINNFLTTSVYTVEYNDGYSISSFRFEVDQFLHIKPDFIKKLQALVAKNHYKRSSNPR